MLFAAVHWSLKADIRGTAIICSLSDKSGHATRRLAQVNAAGRPYAAPVKAESPTTLPEF
jgi:hypothetical protein